MEIKQRIKNEVLLVGDIMFVFYLPICLSLDGVNDDTVRFIE